MNIKTSEVEYTPGYYAKDRLDNAALVDRYFTAWEKVRRSKEKESPDHYPINICISRKIGAGALEIADLLSEMTHFPVIDRAIIEFISSSAELSQKTVEMFDERYLGSGQDLLSMLLGERSFVMNSYIRHLARAVVALGGLGPVIFVGRGSHLLLAQEKVLAVRVVASREYRAQRLAAILLKDKKMAEQKMSEVDRLQKEFFKKAFKKSTARWDEFDLVVNRDRFWDSQKNAQLIRSAFLLKFGEEEQG